MTRTVVTTRKPSWRAAVLSAAVLASLVLPVAGAHAAVAHGHERAHAAPRPWVPAAPAPGSSSTLYGVFCMSAASCFAVGYDVFGQASELNQVLRWKRTRWATARVPNPGGTGKGAYHQLTGIRCTGSRNCWAVGGYASGSAFLNEALHWNGSRWTSATTPTPGGTLSGSINQLYDITCLSAMNCWAVGEYGHTGGPGETLLNEILHWNGRRWVRLATPNPGGTAAADFNVLQGIRCSSAISCLAVGTYGSLSSPPTFLNESLRWNGRRWSVIKTPEPGGKAQGDRNMLLKLTCASPRSCWAVGEYGSTVTSTPENEVLHWNGRAWSVTAVPDPGAASNTLFGVFCSAASSCWAVGEFGDTIAGGDVERNVALRWNGARWSRVATPDPAGTAGNDVNELFGIRCTTRRNCWAVGFGEAAGGRGQDEILHWNGAKWSAR